jgi:hypothetical protein
MKLFSLLGGERSRDRLRCRSGSGALQANGRSAVTAGRAVVALALAALAAALALPAANALDRPGTIQITDTQSKHTRVDVGKHGSSVGDVDVYNLQLFNKRITPKAIGHAEMLCTLVGVRRQSCTATYVLPRGHISAQGVIDSRLIYELAVVGGTGLYDNVRGSLTVTSLGRDPSRELLVFRLVL